MFVCVTCETLEQRSSLSLLAWPTWLCPHVDADGILVHPPHDLLPRFVHLGEHLGLVGKLVLDVWGSKDTLYVEPVSLAYHPLILGSSAVQVTSKGEGEGEKDLSRSRTSDCKHNKCFSLKVPIYIHMYSRYVSAKSMCH